MMTRFAEVFSFAYSRFLELKAKEDQNRELTIQNALERVRARALGMQDSDEITSVAKALLGAFRDLGYRLDSVGIGVHAEDDIYQVSVWSADDLTREGSVAPSTAYAPEPEVAERVDRGEYFTMEGFTRAFFVDYEQHRMAAEGYTPDQIRARLDAIPEQIYGHLAPFPGGAIALRTDTAFTDDDFAVARRFAEVFGFAHSRFLELQAKERQNRALQVEAALERVRSMALAMQTPQDLPSVSAAVFCELQALNFEGLATAIGEADQDRDLISQWTVLPADSPQVQFAYFQVYDSSGIRIAKELYPMSKLRQAHPFLEECVRSFAQDGPPCHVSWHWTKPELIELAERYVELGIWTPEQAKGLQPTWLAETDQCFFQHKQCYLWIFRQVALSAREIEELKRFVEVFSFAYDRFLELQAKERQNRELVVEQALERVRTQVAGMQESQDLHRVVAGVADELKKLGVGCDGVSIDIVNLAERTMRSHLTSAADSAEVAHPGRSIDWDDYGERWEKGAPWSQYLTLEDAIEHGRNLVEKGLVSEEVMQALQAWTEKMPSDGVTMLRVPFANGALAMSRKGPEPFSDDDIALLERFTEVFALGYRRYLDLEAAEERAREANLDRARQQVRGEVMSMKQTEDILGVVGVMCDELNGIGVACDEVGINIIDEAEGTVHTQWSSMVAAVTEQQDTQELGAGTVSSPLVPYWREKKVWSRRRSETGGPDAKGWVVDVPFEYGTLAMNRRQIDDTAEKFTGDEIDILGSFAEVVALGYTRFLDFQLLEEQNRQLTIDRAVERVRAEAAAMKESADIGRVLLALRDGWSDVGVKSVGPGVNIADQEADLFHTYVLGDDAFRGLVEGIRTEVDRVVATDVTPGVHLLRSCDIPLAHARAYGWAHPGLESGYWTAPESFPQELAEQWGTELPGAADYIGRSGINVPFSHGGLFAIADEGQVQTDEDIRLIERFADAVSFGYTRYLDLVAAEDRAREAQLERATERVRAEAMAMESADDIRRVVGVVRRELIALGFSERFPIVINYLDEKDEEHTHAYFALSNPRLRGHTWQSPELWEVDEQTAAGLILWEESHVARALVASQEVVRQAGDIDADALDGILHRVGLEPGAIDLADMGTHITAIPFTHGQIAVRADDFLTDAQIDVVRPLCDGLSLGFTRFQDFQRLEAQNVQIQEANRLKSDFLARMSHDLRTPMNAIIGYTRILLRRAKDVLGDRLYGNLENINTSADHLLHLINDILDLSKIEAGGIDIRPEDVDLGQLVTDCMTSVRPLVKPGVQFEERLEHSDTIHTDPDRLQRVVMNLLSNAVKFTEEGSITVSLKSVDEWVELSVVDTGPGIPAADLPFIFEEFRQVEGEKKEGTGLGLSIAKKSIELLGGTISAESEVGEGTTFKLRIRDYESANV